LDAFLVEFLIQNLVLCLQILDDFLLLVIHPAGQNHEEELQGCRMNSMIGLMMGRKAPPRALNCRSSTRVTAKN
jgi:hypothetical protein